MKLILGFYRAGSGAITIGGKPYGEFTLDEIRDLCAWVPQDAYLFDGTIEENIRFGNKAASHEDVIEAARNTGFLFVMDGERIVEEGTHENLLSVRGKYHRFWTRMQE